MRGWNLLGIGIALVLIALAGLLLVGGSSSVWQGQRGFWLPTEFRSNGERIYYTATSESGVPITFTSGPHWLDMHGGSCVDCHGPGGRGGIRVPMTYQIAPDIRYGTLTSMEHDEDKHPPYTDALIKRAITEGLDPADRPLDWAMPRWRMSDRDMDDLVSYLKTLDGEQ